MPVAAPPVSPPIDAPVHGETAGGRGLARPEPGLAVLVFPTDDDLAVAGALLRPAPALALVADPAALDGQPEAAAAAGFDVRAAETLPAAAQAGRLRALPEAPTVLVTGTPSAGRSAHLARAAGAPVLAVPPGATAGTGPAVMRAGDARCCVVPVVRAVASGHLLLVGPPSAGREAARALADRFGLRVDVVGGAGGDAARTLAGELDGLLAVADHHRWRAPRDVAVELGRDRPVLVVPARGGRR